MDLCTGIVDLEAAQDILLVPNPTVGLMVVQNHGILTGLVDISVKDLSGRVVMEVPRTELENMNLPIDLSNLANGQYVLNMIKDNSRIATIKLSKQ